jgi:hypothetical protein
MEGLPNGARRQDDSNGGRTHFNRVGSMDEKVGLAWLGDGLEVIR